MPSLPLSNPFHLPLLPLFFKLMASFSLVVIACINISIPIYNLLTPCNIISISLSLTLLQFCKLKNLQKSQTYDFNPFWLDICKYQELRVKFYAL